MGQIIHIEVTSSAVEDSAEFFEAALGWQSTASPFLPGYMMSDTGEGSGIDAAIMSRDYQQQPVIAWVHVDNIHAALAAISAHGGAAAGDLNELPGQGLVGYFTDPAGVLWGMKQPL